MCPYLRANYSVLIDHYVPVLVSKLQCTNRPLCACTWAVVAMQEYQRMHADSSVTLKYQVQSQSSNFAPQGKLTAIAYTVLQLLHTLLDTTVHYAVLWEYYCACHTFSCPAFPDTGGWKRKENVDKTLWDVSHFLSQMGGLDVVLRRYANLTDHLRLFVSSQHSCTLCVHTQEGQSNRLCQSVCQSVYQCVSVSVCVSQCVSMSVYQ